MDSTPSWDILFMNELVQKNSFSDDQVDPDQRLALYLFFASCSSLAQSKSPLSGLIGPMSFFVSFRLALIQTNYLDHSPTYFQLKPCCGCVWNLYLGFKLHNPLWAVHYGSLLRSFSFGLDHHHGPIEKTSKYFVQDAWFFTCFFENSFSFDYFENFSFCSLRYVKKFLLNGII